MSTETRETAPLGDILPLDCHRGDFSWGGVGGGVYVGTARSSDCAHFTLLRARQSTLDDKISTTWKHAGRSREISGPSARTETTGTACRRPAYAGTAPPRGTLSY